jgi:hypothetical protein
MMEYGYRIQAQAGYDDNTGAVRNTVGSDDAWAASIVGNTEIACNAGAVYGTGCYSAVYYCHRYADFYNPVLRAGDFDRDWFGRCRYLGCFAGFHGPIPDHFRDFSHHCFGSRDHWNHVDGCHWTVLDPVDGLVGYYEREADSGYAPDLHLPDFPDHDSSAFGFASTVTASSDSVDGRYYVLKAFDYYLPDFPDHDSSAFGFASTVTLLSDSVDEWYCVQEALIDLHLPDCFDYDLYDFVFGSGSPVTFSFESVAGLCCVSSKFGFLPDFLGYAWCAFGSWKTLISCFGFVSELHSL